MVFNSQHDIKIKGYDVEVYVQDLNEKNKSIGVYSIVSNEWLNFPGLSGWMSLYIFCICLGVSIIIPSRSLCLLSVLLYLYW